MDYHLVYTQRAINDLAEIIGYIAEDNPDAASRFGQSLLDHLDLLRNYPRVVTSVRDRSHVRRLVHSPILIYYQIQERAHAIEILHLRHGSRMPPLF